ncbi:hypothetical protein IR152_18500 [Clostridioides sp. ES-S-0108-01]|uniref:hypothetical protein n=1 Tax=Clostridioides sp. ES-S-0108-01 TaxID=2770773 RepID=UPI001D0C4103|nr:hypothetical protein [Clostridioides sp. ES-S-0108-01]UDN52412.1 hypothetical protein JJC16_07110 [Clostridioides sp. ES-S-0107-01]
MKRFFLLIILCLLSIGVVACSSNDDNEDYDDVPKIEKKSNPNEIDGIRITVKGVSKEEMKGDYDKDGTPNENGEYFGVGADAKKAADYEYKVVNVTVENTTDRPVKLFEAGWNKDGTDWDKKIKDIKVTDKLDNKEVPAHDKFDAQVKILTEKKMNVKEIVLKYNLTNYTNLEEAINYGDNGASKEDLKKRYPELYKENWIELGTIKFE